MVCAECEKHKERKMTRKRERELLQHIIDLRIEEREYIKKYYLDPLRKIIDLTRGAYQGRENVAHVLRENLRFSEYWKELLMGGRR